MSSWRVEVSETITQQSVYIIDADSREQAQELVRDEETEMEQLSTFIENRTIDTVLSAELYPEDL